MQLNQCRAHLLCDICIAIAYAIHTACLLANTVLACNLMALTVCWSTQRDPDVKWSHLQELFFAIMFQRDVYEAQDEASALPPDDAPVNTRSSLDNVMQYGKRVRWLFTSLYDDIDMYPAHIHLSNHDTSLAQMDHNIATSCLSSVRLTISRWS